MQRKKKFGLALGGGFLRGAAHIGVLKVLEREGCKPDIIAGTSAGSIVASFYAAGYSLEEIEQIFTSLKPRDVYDTWSTLTNLLLIMGSTVCSFFKLRWPFKTPLGLMSGNKLEKFLRNYLNEYRFARLKMLLAITSVDINCGAKVIFVNQPLRKIVMPDEVYLHNFKIADAVRASVAVPGLFEPKKIADYQLTDGGLREQVPAEVLHDIGADVVLAVDVGYDGDACSKVSGIAHLLLQTLDIIRQDSIKRALDQYADMIIRPVLEKISPFDFDRIQYAIDQGQAEAEKQLPEIKKLLC